jgi:hypothetical protein
MCGKGGRVVYRRRPAHTAAMNFTGAKMNSK